jgi:phenylacetate-coenzyme A ligase PaaK-like adenylate-forming protein
VPISGELFSLSDAAVRGIVDEMADFAPDFLLVNPVYAHWIARRARDLALQLPPVSLVLSSYQYPSLLQRRAIEMLYGAPLRSMYSATELGGCQVGLECSRGRLHSREDHCLVEILEDGGNGPGPVIVTTLASQSMPLVRYDVGDLAIWDRKSCDCPMQHWPTFVLHGREQERLRLGDRRLTVRAIDELVSAVPGVDFYSCRQDSAGVAFDVIPARGVTLDARRLAIEFGERLVARVSVHVVGRLDPSPSLKFPQILPLPADSPRC